MPTTNMSHLALNHALGKELTENELRTALFDMGMELENVEGDDIAIEVTAERLDLISVQGLARALKAFLGLKKVKTYETKYGGFVVNVTNKVKQVRPFTVCAVIKNISLTDERIKEIINVQEKLHSTLARGRRKGAIGIYPFEHISFPIFYTAAPPESIKFKPLGAFREMSALEILKLNETGKEFAHLLEGKDVFPYFIDSNKKILSLPPIINSESTGRVTENTKDIFIECSGFDKLLLNELLTNLVTMFADMGGEIFNVSVNYEDGQKDITPHVKFQEKTFSTYTLKKLIGLNLSVDKIKVLLERMMYIVKDVKELTENQTITGLTNVDSQLNPNNNVGTSEFLLMAPPFRKDIWHEVDIAEDIARAYGYNNLPLTYPLVSTIGGTLPLSDLREELTNVMVGQGFLETYTFALTSIKDQLENMLLSKDSVGFVPVANGNETQTMLRISLIPEELKALSHNRDLPLPQKIFEADFVVLPDVSTDVKSRNELHLASLITDRKVTFTQIKQSLDALLQTRGVEVSIKPTNHPSFIKGRAGVVMFDDKPIGIVGEIHPQVLINFGLSAPVAAFEINLEELL